MEKVFINKLYDFFYNEEITERNFILFTFQSFQQRTSEPNPAIDLTETDDEDDGFDFQSSLAQFIKDNRGIEKKLETKNSKDLKYVL